MAADRGAQHALALGLRVELAIGDFDSIAPAALDALVRSGARLERHPAAKDETDFELALDAAAALNPRRILAIGGAAGRLDHLLAELVVLGADAYGEIEVDALLAGATVHVIRGERSFSGKRDELVSLLPLYGPARGITTVGLAYPLRDESLGGGGSSRGVSNLFAQEQARVIVRSGVLVAVRPGIGAGLAELRNEPNSGREESASS